MSWSSPYEGWHPRALSNPHPDPNTFTPSRDKLRFASFRSTLGEPEGFSLAFFSPSATDKGVPDGGLIAVDALGRVLIVSPADAQGILDLSKKTLDLLPAEANHYQWRIKHLMTCRPIDSIIVPRSELAQSLLDDKLEISVYGFLKGYRALENSMNDVKELPALLWELFGLVLEAREGATMPKEDGRNQDVLGKVKDVFRVH